MNIVKILFVFIGFLIALTEAGIYSAYENDNELVKCYINNTVLQ